MSTTRRDPRADNTRTALPTVTVTFLFTDVEGSTALWEQHAEQMRGALGRHDELIETIAAEFQGEVVRPRGEGDSRFVVFARPRDAVASACAIQRAFARERWPVPQPLKIRIAVHTGAAVHRAGDYYGRDVNRCARLRSCAYGGQTLISGVTADLVKDALPPSVELKALGTHHLKDLADPERVYQLVHPSLRTEFPPIKSLSSLRNSVPLELTSFVGRDREVVELRQMLQDKRLITLTGTGGTGKTRLAYHVAAEALDEFEDGVWIAELASIVEEALVPQLVATALGVQVEPGEAVETCLVGALRSRNLLLVLDNCEHLSRACGELTRTLLLECPHVRVLATSRQPLAVEGETTWRIPSLTIAARGSPPEIVATCEAVRLFVDRATLVRPDFALTDGNAEAVAEICRRVDGIPLALELAAARVRVLTPEQIADRLRDQLHILTGGSSLLPDRHRTLRTAIDWSYELLTERERTVFARLAVFSGGFDLVAAEAVCGGDGIEASDILDVLTELIDKSLVTLQGDAGDEQRYRVMETLRQYALERLMEFGTDKEATLRARHAAYYVTVAERAEPELIAANANSWVRRLTRNHDNFRVALHWAEQSEQPELGLRIGCALWRFWEIRGHAREGCRWLETFLQLASEDSITPAARGRALLRAGSMSRLSGDYSQAQGYLMAALQLRRTLGDTRGVAAALANLGFIAQEQGEYATARPLMEESLELFRSLDDQRGVAAMLTNVGVNATEMGDHVTAKSLIEHSLGLSRQSGHRQAIAVALQDLAYVELNAGEYQRAIEPTTQSLALARELGDATTVALCLKNLGSIALAERDFGRAGALYRDALQALSLNGNRRFVADCLEGLGVAAAGREAGRSAAFLLGAADALRAALNLPLSASGARFHAESVATTRRLMSDEDVSQAWAAGHTTPLDQVVEYALADVPEGDSGDTRTKLPA